MQTWSGKLNPMKTGVDILIDRASVSYRGRQVTEALRDVSFALAAGEFVSLLGPSGCGKSTVLALVAGLLAPSTGTVSCNGRQIRSPMTSAGMVFQKPVLLEWRTTLGNVLLSAQAHRLESSVAQERARGLLTTVGLAGFENAYPRELSGGMQQRAAICRALIHDPPLLLMDEPFAALDAITRDQLALDLGRLFLERRPSVLFVTHSIPEAVFLSDKVVVMTNRPGTVSRILSIDLPRPRTLHIRQTPRFGAYVEEILGLFVAAGLLREDGNPPAISDTA